ncbi:hypothetical protein [Actinokineospora sp. HUAS TT18]|uniref:hypothetical protein n=1 Tax=Actinokineospora sp. HUAS TT18 TaxID=3447451 RepID=UPI003F51E75E
MTALIDGPAVVWRGDRGAADVIAVLDPAGEASHGELPATWRPLSERVLVGWVRLPADGAGVAAVGAALPMFDGRHTHIVTSGPAVELALWLTAAHQITTFLAVDPEPCDGSLACVDGPTRARWWDALPERDAAVHAGVAVHSFYSDPLDLHSPAPAPLGLPEVVSLVTATVRGG